MAKNREEITKNRSSIIRLENVLGNKIDALFDGYKQNTEGIYRLENRFYGLERKVEKQERCEINYKVSVEELVE